MKLDFNSTSFSHPKSGSLSLSNPDPEIRSFWIEHTKRCRAIAEEMGKAQGDPCIMNVWVHDGSKDLTVNRMKYRELLKDSLDQIFEQKYDNMKDCIESKVFGIGLESYTVGSNDFYIGYGTSRGKIVTLDTGHFHPTEIVADKLSSLLLFIPGGDAARYAVPCAGTRDHVAILNDETHDCSCTGDRARPTPSTACQHRSRLLRRLDQPHRRLRRRLAAPRRSALLQALLDPARPNCANTRPTDRASSVWRYSKSRSRCPGTPCGTCSACARTTPPSARNSSPKSRNTNARSPRNARKSWRYSSDC